MHTSILYTPYYDWKATGPEKCSSLSTDIQEMKTEWQLTHEEI